MKTYSKLAVVLSVAIAGITTSGYAGPIALIADGTVGFGIPAATNGGTVFSGGSLSNTFDTGGVTGLLGVTVLTGAAANNDPDNGPNLGGLTFVYEIKVDVGVSAGKGIINFAMAGWGTHQTAIELGSNFYYSPFASTNDGNNNPRPPVLPLNASRSHDGDTIFFDFPDDNLGPPIFSGEISYQLIVHTDAQSYATNNGLMTAYDFNAVSSSSINVTSLAAEPAGVPDSGATALLLGLALVGLSSLRRKFVR